MKFVSVLCLDPSSRPLQFEVEQSQLEWMKKVKEFLRNELVLLTVNRHYWTVFFKQFFHVLDETKQT